MNEISTKIFSNQSNKKVLSYINIDVNREGFYFIKWVGGRNGPDEGGTFMFDIYGKEVPENCKYSLDGTNVMINPLTGQIFAFHVGRFSIFFRCDFERTGLINSEGYRKGFTFDCIRDITILGENWAFAENAEFEDDRQNQFKWAYEKTMKLQK